jgi:tetratricopeptide (TPR) repeat protein
VLLLRPTVDAGRYAGMLEEALQVAATGDYDAAEALLRQILDSGSPVSRTLREGAQNLSETLIRKRNTIQLAQSYLDRDEYDRALQLVDALLIESPRDAQARRLLDAAVAAKRSTLDDRAAQEQAALAQQQASLGSGLASLGESLREQTRDPIQAQERQAAAEATARERERVARINELTRKGVGQLNASRYGEARSTFEEVLQTDPQSAAARTYLGYATFREAPDDAAAQERAVQLLTRAAQEDPTLWQPHDYLAQIYEKNNDPVNALREYKEAARLNPSNFDILYAMGKLQYNARQFEDAARSFGAAAVVDPKSSKAHYNKAMSYLALSDAPKALAAFRDAVAAQPDYARAYYEMANVLWSQSRDAAKTLDALGSAVKYEPRNAAYVRRLGEILSVSGRHKEAEAAFAQALGIDPANAETNYNMAIVKLALGAPKDAVLYATTAVEASPSTARYDYQLGLAHERNGDTDAAARSYALAIQHDPAYLPPMVNLGKLYDDGGRYDEAMAILAKACQLAPADFAANNNLGNAYQHKGLYQKAIEHFGIALKTSPTAVATRYNLGLAYAELGRDAEAKQSFQDVVRMDPAYWDGYLKLARLSIKEGDRESARSLLKTLLERNPRYEKKDEAASLLNQLGA